MARTKTTKTETESVTTTSVSAPVSTTVVDASSSSSTSTKAKKSKTPKVETAPVVESTTVVSTAPVTTETGADTGVDGEAPVAEQAVEFFAKLQQLGVLISSLKTEYKVLEKKWSRDLKSAQKLNTKSKRKTASRAPSGFVKPTRISDELAKFLEKPSGSEMARTEVTRDINKYIRANNLQDKENGRKINPDAKLAVLLKLKKTDELTYFNLQRYMSPHFAKASKDVTTSV